MVPIAEMVDTLRIIKNVPVLKNGDYVRLKRTMYKGDLAQVDWVEVAHNQVCLRLLPRIDYKKKRGVLKNVRITNLNCKHSCFRTKMMTLTTTNCLHSKLRKTSVRRKTDLRQLRLMPRKFMNWVQKLQLTATSWFVKAKDIDADCSTKSFR